jgi:hypothetical protein
MNAPAAYGHLKTRIGSPQEKKVDLLSGTEATGSYTWGMVGSVRYI